MACLYGPVPLYSPTVKSVNRPAVFGKLGALSTSFSADESLLECILYIL